MVQSLSNTPHENFQAKTSKNDMRCVKAEPGSGQGRTQINAWPDYCRMRLSAHQEYRVKADITVEQITFHAGDDISRPSLSAIRTQPSANQY